MLKTDKDILDFQKKFMELIMPQKFPKALKEELLEYVSFRKELTSESDRGCALLAASHLDFLLEGTLSAKLRGTKKHKKQLFDFNGPLGTFSGRMLMAYSLCLVLKKVYIFYNDPTIDVQLRAYSGNLQSIL